MVIFDTKDNLLPVGGLEEFETSWPLIWTEFQRFVAKADQGVIGGMAGMRTILHSTMSTIMAKLESKMLMHINAHTFSRCFNSGSAQFVDMENQIVNAIWFCRHAILSLSVP